MVGLHRNSQKRIYIEGVVYFITTKTKNNYPFFRDPILARLLIEELRVVKQMKGFRIFGFVIMPDHIHALIQPSGRFTISQIMFTVKKQFSHNANRLLGWNPIIPTNEGGQVLGRLRDYVMLHRKSGPRFAWQSSFHDHIIRNDRDFENHINYTHNNPVKAGYVKCPEDWPWSSCAKSMDDAEDLIYQFA